MLITKVVLVLVFTILQSQTDAKLLDGVSAEYQIVPDIYIRLEEVLKSCFLSRLSTLVITSDLNEVIPGILNDSVAANMLVLDENFNPLQSHRNFPRWPIFVLTANSTVRLSRMLRQLKPAAFWHAELTFMFVDVPKGRCGEASSMLWTSWNMDLLASFYICEDSKRGVMLYTYNPFTNRAPAPWNKVETLSDGRWTLYSRSFSKDKSICKFLQFDKTEILDGYGINAVMAVAPGSTLKDNETLTVTNLTKLTPSESIMTYTAIWSKMNVTPMTYIDRKIYSSDKLRRKFAVKFNDRVYDLLVGGMILEPMGNETYGMTYPYTMLSLSILTNHREFLTPAEKIGNFYSFGAMSLTGLFLLILWIVFVIQKGDKIAAALEILRMALSTGIMRPLQSISIRIYLFGVLWLVLVLNATFQGNISTFLTKPTRIDVETISDLQTYRYRVYVPEQYSDALSESVQNIPKNLLTVVNGTNCDGSIVNDTKGACVQHLTGMFYTAKKYNLHISHEPVVKLFRIGPYREDWSLAKKHRVYLSRLMAAGLLHYWRANSETKEFKKLEARDAQQTAPVIRKIKLIDLNFAFIILGIGLTISTLFFVVEVSGNPMKKRPSKVEKPPQNLRRRVTRSNIAV